MTRSPQNMCKSRSGTISRKRFTATQSNHAPVSNSMPKSISVRKQRQQVRSVNCQRMIWHRRANWPSRTAPTGMRVVWVDRSWFATIEGTLRAIFIVLVRNLIFTCRMRLWHRGGVRCMRLMPERVDFAFEVNQAFFFSYPICGSDSSWCIIYNWSRVEPECKNY